MKLRQGIPQGDTRNSLISKPFIAQSSARARFKDINPLFSDDI